MAGPEAGRLSGASPRFRVRRLRADEVELWREVRLRALRDSPEAFGSVYEVEVEHPLEVWQQRTAVLAAGHDRVMFLAEDSGGRVVGCAGGIVEPGGTPFVISMWVEPESRGGGAGWLLLEAIAAWTRERGASRLKLMVVTENRAAIELYARFGFRPTGFTERNERGRLEEEMELELGG